MHNRLLITSSMPDIATSEDVRWAIYETLIVDTSFCGDGGRFGSPLCDWFVIGGRWSGFITESLLGQEYRSAVESLEKSLEGSRLSADYEEIKSKALDALWCEHGGTGMRPELRDAYEELGYPDDAVLITDRVYKLLLSEYVGTGSDGHQFVDLDDDEVTPDFIGTKWLVVVDYHY